MRSGRFTEVHAHKVSPGHAERTRIRLEQNVFPWLGRLALASVTAPKLLECLRWVEKRGTVETAHRVKQACGQVFRYGIATGHCERDPSGDLRNALRPAPCCRGAPCGADRAATGGRGRTGQREPVRAGQACPDCRYIPWPPGRGGGAGFPTCDTCVSDSTKKERPAKSTTCANYGESLRHGTCAPHRERTGFKPYADTRNTNGINHLGKPQVI